MQKHHDGGLSLRRFCRLFEEGIRIRAADLLIPADGVPAHDAISPLAKELCTCLMLAAAGETLDVRFYSRHLLDGLCTFLGVFEKGAA